MKFDPNDNPAILDELDELASAVYAGSANVHDVGLVREHAATLLSEAYECYKSLHRLASSVNDYLQDSDKDALKRELFLVKEHLVELENS